MLPILNLSTQSAEEGYLKHQSKSKTWFHYEIPYIKTFVTLMEEYLIYSLHFVCGVSSLLRNSFPVTFSSKITCSRNINTLKKFQVFWTVRIPFVAANEKICENLEEGFSLMWICFCLTRPLDSPFCFHKANVFPWP